MNKGVEIMLARMDSNPEEFVGADGWTRIYNDYKKFMSDEEQTAVITKLRELKMNQFEKEVLKKLFREENKNGEVNFNNGTGQVIISTPQGTKTFTSTIQTGSIKLGDTELTETDLQDLKEMI